MFIYIYTYEYTHIYTNIFTGGGADRGGAVLDEEGEDVHTYIHTCIYTYIYTYICISFIYKIQYIIHLYEYIYVYMQVYIYIRLGGGADRGGAVFDEEGEEVGLGQVLLLHHLRAGAIAITQYRGTRECTSLGPYRRPMPRVLGGS